MRTEIKHTPTPWYANCPEGHAPTIYGPGDSYVATAGWTRRNKAAEIKQADARHIVNCVNLHDELVVELEELVKDYFRDRGLDFAAMYADETFDPRGQHLLEVMAKVNQ